MTEQNPGAPGGQPERPAQPAEGAPQPPSAEAGQQPAGSPWPTPAPAPPAAEQPPSVWAREQPPAGSPTTPTTGTEQPHPVGLAAPHQAGQSGQLGDQPGAGQYPWQPIGPQGTHVGGAVPPAGATPAAGVGPTDPAPGHGAPHQGGVFLPPPGQPARPSRAGKLVGAALLALALATGAGVGGGWVGYELAKDRYHGPSALEAAPPAARSANSAPAGSVEQVAQKLLPSVVELQVQGRTQSGTGSGFVISGDGYVLTNNHVVEAAANGGRIGVVFQDGRTLPAQIVGRAPTYDLAVVKVEGASRLPQVELGRSDDLQVGQEVVAIGAPFQLAGTVTSGIISAMNRPVSPGDGQSDVRLVLNAIQTDAAINPGNSGGPLVDRQGRVIGINSVIYSPKSGSGGQAGSVGLGFAIPIDQAKRVAKELTEQGRATQPVLGVSTKTARAGGAEIAEVVSGSGAEQAGLKAGDVITKVDARRISGSEELVATVRSYAPGTKVKVTLRADGGGERTAEVTLGSQPASE
ncbi:trypsin-like peptidase domain-containing protein [Streptoalloteichus hindustanus]|uniref:Putative serine protease PepD n=1 Tax=Streptoalloteichus hindustanus TaxID=2017 RepID=A0A1M5KY03_STRHI|nr:trypsin-like peptidase domain-containing protein [Streptoalloteichus hindustanus]SHG57752.1 putative serine protease PepD [Streptoalloteichus hindustanus]